jgi:hypothetical protein
MNIIQSFAFKNIFEKHLFFNKKKKLVFILLHFI